MTTHIKLFCKGFFCNRGLWAAVLRGIIGLIALGIILIIAMSINLNYGLWIFLGLFALIFIPALLWMKEIGLAGKIRAGLTDAINRPAKAERLGSLLFYAVSQGTLWGVGVHVMLFFYMRCFPSYSYDSPSEPSYLKTLLITILYGQLLGVLFMAGFIRTKAIRWAIYGVPVAVMVWMIFEA